METKLKSKSDKKKAVTVSETEVKDTVTEC